MNNKNNNIKLTVMRSIFSKALLVGVILIACIGIAFTSVHKKSQASIKSPNIPLMNLTVNVTQDPDICAVESPCTPYVVITKAGVPIATPQAYTGAGNYYFTVAQNTNGTLIATVVNNYPSGGCTCVLNPTPASQPGPPYGTFYVTIP